MEKKKTSLERARTFLCSSWDVFFFGSVFDSEQLVHPGALPGFRGGVWDAGKAAAPPRSHTHHEGVVGELVPVEEVLEEIGALVAGVPPGHGRAHRAHLRRAGTGEG